ncbi:MAG: heme-copper oxidase subunit [Dehalococcoidia bacterium]|nr:heme-copper oxidase subunit [Dehalococcoidia bacterium]
MTTITHAHKQASRLYINRLGLWLFIISEGFLFSALISSRFYLQGLNRPEELNQPLGLAITITLLLSGLTAYRAETSAAFGNQSGFMRNCLATIVLGSLFLLGVGIEWSEGFKHFPPHTGYGTLFFTVTGFHAFHMISGLGVLILVLLLGRNGRYRPGNFWPVEGAVKYWHFVDVAWIFIYPTLYLVG